MADSIWFVPAAEPGLFVRRPLFLAIKCKVVSKNPFDIDELHIYPPSQACCFKTMAEAEEELFVFWKDILPRIPRPVLQQSTLEEYRKFVLSVCPEQKHKVLAKGRSDWFTLYDMVDLHENGGVPTDQTSWWQRRATLQVGV